MLLTRQIFEKNKSSRAASISWMQFWPRNTSGDIETSETLITHFNFYYVVYKITICDFLVSQTIIDCES